jgi:hypothetical protein
MTWIFNGYFYLDKYFKSGKHFCKEKAKVVPSHAIGEIEVQVRFLLIWHRMEMTVQPQAPGDLPSRKETPVHVKWEAKC